MQLNRLLALAFSLAVQIELSSIAVASKLEPLSGHSGDAISSICELTQRGKEAGGAQVRVRAIFTSDLLERSVITDPKCPSVVVIPFDAEESKLDVESIRRFDAAVAGKLSDHTIRVFSVDVSGTYVWRGDEQPAGALYIEKVWYFKRRKAD
ncbi:hypothetical protein [Xanthomonas sp. LF06-19]|uniref:hypothetical protein n=1 Tax=Xanthomonas sp. LF06-19 TaxID=3097551 RepID=UPI002A827708|nr:hypothetical protein [Xanthomonas sp. LF06-19]MDY4282971.1 hypothetical protein [Xanthomonas sp. LF06-19]